MKGCVGGLRLVKRGGVVVFVKKGVGSLNSYEHAHMHTKTGHSPTTTSTAYQPQPQIVQAREALRAVALGELYKPEQYAARGALGAAEVNECGCLL